jgi:hypothetical protein
MALSINTVTNRQVSINVTNSKVSPVQEINLNNTYPQTAPVKPGSDFTILFIQHDPVVLSA